jgi:Spy/CpxP family protein refolding chaperone
MTRLACLTCLLAALAASNVAAAQPGEVMQPAPSTRVRAHHKHDATADLLGDALSDLTLKDGQKASIDAIRHECTQKHAATKRVNKALLDALAKQVEDGAFEGADLRAKIEAALAAAADEAKTRATSLDKLHVVLDKSQRQKLAEVLEARLEDDPSESYKTELKQLAEDLNLNADQKKDLGAFYKDHAKEAREQRAHAREIEKKVIEAFKTDKFPADKLVTPADARTRTQNEVDKLLGLVERILPKLSADQRGLVVTMLHDRANGSAAIRL